MRGTRKKALRLELIALLGRGPMKKGAIVPRYGAEGLMASGVMEVVKDEFRVYKKAWKEVSRLPHRRFTNPGCNPQRAPFGKCLPVGRDGYALPLNSDFLESY